jgi:acetolactate synthase-1/2/3 large subunit
VIEFVERTGIPVAQTLMALGSYPEQEPLALQMLGMHGTVTANYAVNEADLLLAFGARFDDRVTGGCAGVLRVLEGRGWGGVKGAHRPAGWP